MADRKAKIRGSIIIVIVIAQLVFMFSYCCEKDFFDGDEMFSYSLSNGYYTPFLRWNKDWWNQWHDTDYLTEQITVSAGEAFDYGSVIYNQTQDVHPPVFYCVLHTICSLDPGHFSKWQGISLNLIFYGLTLILLYRTACIMLGDETAAVIPMLHYGVCAGAVTTVIYIRMYMLLTLLCVLDVYLHSLLLKKCKKRNRVLAAIFLTTVVGGLTQYYFFVFAVISSAIYCAMELPDSARKCVQYGMTRTGSVIAALLIFPSAITHATTGSRGIANVSGILGNLSDIGKWIERIRYYMSFVDRQLFNEIGLLIGIVTMTIGAVALLLPGRGKPYLCRNILGGGRKTFVYVSCLWVSYVFFITNYAPKVGKGFRYIINIYPLISLSVFYLLIRLTERLARAEYRVHILAVLCLGTVCVSIASNKAENIEYLDTSNAGVIDQIQDCNTSAHCFINKSDSQEYSFWMQYQNMSRKEGQQFLVTTYDRILEMDDQCLNQMIYEKYDNGILMYIVTGYSQQEAERIVESIIDRTNLKELEYIGTADSERIFFCKD